MKARQIIYIPFDFLPMNLGNALLLSPDTFLFKNFYPDYRDRYIFLQAWLRECHSWSVVMSWYCEIPRTIYQSRDGLWESPT